MIKDLKAEDLAPFARSEQAPLDRSPIGILSWPRRYREIKVRNKPADVARIQYVRTPGL